MVPAWSTRTARDRRDTATHTALLDAAEALFSEHGYKQTPVAQIADRAGVSRATFYVYFSSRDEVFRALARRVHDEIAEIQRSAGRSSDDPQVVIETSIRAALAIYARKTRLLTVVAHQALADGAVAALWERILRAPSEVDEKFIENLQRGNGALPAASPELVAEVVTAALLRYGAIAAEAPGRIDELASALTAVYLRLVGWERRQSAG